jgi:CDP-glycerol glycerophosphotransferase
MKLRNNKNSYACHFKFVLCLILAKFVNFFSFGGRHKSRPVVMLYGHSLSGNLSAFLKFAQSQTLPYDVYYYTIDSREFAKLVKKGDQNIILGTTVHSCRQLLNASCLMTSHGPGIMILLRLLAPHMKYVDVWHGISFRAYSREDFKGGILGYDRIFVSSDHQRDNYLHRYGFRDSQICVTGYAQVDGFANAATTNSQVRRDLGIADDLTIGLYAPTWRGSDDSGEIPFGADPDQFLECLDKVAESLDAIIILRLHINSQIKIDLENHKHLLSVNQSFYPATNDLLCATDVLITDWSSIAADFYALRRPVVFLDTPPPAAFKKGLTDLDRAGVIVPSLEELSAAIETSLSDVENTEATQYDAFCKCYGRSIDGQSAARYSDELTQLLKPNTDVE